MYDSEYTPPYLLLLPLLRWNRLVRSRFRASSFSSSSSICSVWLDAPLNKFYASQYSDRLQCRRLFDSLCPLPRKSNHEKEHIWSASLETGTRGQKTEWLLFTPRPQRHKKVTPKQMVRMGMKRPAMLSLRASKVTSKGAKRQCIAASAQDIIDNVCLRLPPHLASLPAQNMTAQPAYIWQRCLFLTGSPECYS